MKILFLSLLLVVGVCAQTSEGLRKTFGPPRSETYVEVYTLRASDKSSSLSAEGTFTYSKDKSNLESIRVEIYPQFSPEQPGTDEEEEAKTKLLKNVLEEILPMDRRGKLLTSGFFSGVGIYGSFERYEKVRLFYSPHGNRSVTVSFKEAPPECLGNPTKCWNK